MLKNIFSLAVFFSLVPSHTISLFLSFFFFIFAIWGTSGTRSGWRRPLATSLRGARGTRTAGWCSTCTAAMRATRACSGTMWCAESLRSAPISSTWPSTARDMAAALASSRRCGRTQASCSPRSSQLSAARALPSSSAPAKVAHRGKKN
jgi:hypothetical protein